MECTNEDFSKMIWTYSMFAGLNMFNQIKQYYHVRFRTNFAWSHVNLPIWTSQF